MNLTFFFVKILCLFIAAHLSAQTKFEREYRIAVQDVPEMARLFVDSIQFDKKVNWYFEENLEGNSIEAKSCKNKKRYSIEFDTLGAIQDVEIQISWKEIPAAVQVKITTGLQGLFDSHKIRKIQIQYSGARAELLRLANGTANAGTYTVRYELVVKGKQPDGVHLFEITCSETGELLDSARIMLKNTDNLEY